MSKLGYTYYELASPELRKIFLDVQKESRRCYRVARKWAIAQGGTGGIMTGDQGSHIFGIVFKEKPDPKLWRACFRDAESYGWIPKKNTKKGQELYREFMDLPGWSLEPIQEAVKYKDFLAVVDGQRLMYRFAFGWTADGKFACFRVPVFSNEVYKEYPDARYKPVPGLKEISMATYAKKMGI